MNQNKYTAFIPVREGSKSIPFKNIRPIAGKPLVCWSIEAACECAAIGEVYISTDGESIRRCVEEHMGEFSYSEKVRFADRDPVTASDTASTESAMLDFAGKVDFQNIILIQATSPLLAGKDLDAGIRIYEQRDCFTGKKMARDVIFLSIIILNIVPGDRNLTVIWWKTERFTLHPRRHLSRVNAVCLEGLAFMKWKKLLILK